MVVILWEFVPKSGSERQFEAAYGSRGVWARLFQKGKGYLGSELIKDTDSTRYLTIDRWASEEDHRAFQTQYADEYKRIDGQCELLTQSEKFLGIFSSVEILSH